MSRVRFPMVSLKIFHWLNSSGRTVGSGVDLTFSRNEWKVYHLGAEGGLCLTTFMCRLSWNLGASTPWNHLGLYKHCSTFYIDSRLFGITTLLGTLATWTVTKFVLCLTHTSGFVLGRRGRRVQIHTKLLWTLLFQFWYHSTRNLRLTQWIYFER